MGKEAHRRIAHRFTRFFRPVTGLFSWWYPFRLGTTDIVVLADSMAVFMVAFGGMYMFYGGWNYVLLYCILLPLLPLVFLTIVVIKRRDTKVWRLFCFVPYWVHRVPIGSRFELCEAWGDPVPSGVAFETNAADSLHLGTPSSAEPLFRHLSHVLEKAGWRQTAFGWEMPLDS